MKIIKAIILILMAYMFFVSMYFRFTNPESTETQLLIKTFNWNYHASSDTN